MWFLFVLFSSSAKVEVQEKKIVEKSFPYENWFLLWRHGKILFRFSPSSRYVMEKLRTKFPDNLNWFLIWCWTFELRNFDESSVCGEILEIQSFSHFITWSVTICLLAVWLIATRMHCILEGINKIFMKPSPRLMHFSSLKIFGRNFRALFIFSQQNVFSAFDAC